MTVGAVDAASSRPTVDVTVEPQRQQLTRTRPVGTRGAASEDPRRVGRFAITRRLGTGGMSVVYEALDERVDRPVALKLMLEHRSDSARLRREAQALARLSHPNVVEVFEVGEHDGKAYVAMELVDGPSLDRWLRLRRRSTAEIVEVFIQAGQGLAAAHAQGLVHRDFKPGNVLLGADGRARVVDFGLVREAGPDDSSFPGLAEADHPSSASGASGPLPLPPGWEQSLTKTGVMVGTPAYMSPEQLSGLPAGPASDQFGFCTALYEALHGQHPFVAGNDWSQLPYNVLDGKLQRPQGRHRVPHALFEVIARGLATRPEARWPSMPVLLQELRRRLDRQGLRPGPMAAAAAALAVALWGLHSSSATPSVDRCEEAAQTMHAAWNPEVRDELQQAWFESGRADAVDTWARVEPRLVAYADDWWSLHHEACSGPAPAPSAALCLGRVADGLATHLRVMASPNDTLLDNAVQMVARLPGIERCADEPDEPAVGLEGRWQAELDRIDALYNAGQYPEGLAELEALMSRSQLEASPRLTVELELRQGRLLTVTSHNGDLAASALENAYLGAKPLGLDRLAAEAAIELVRLFGEYQHRPNEAVRWAGHARAAAEQLDDPLLTSEYLNANGRAMRGRGELSAALEQHQRALEIQQQLLPADSTELAISHFQLGSTMGMLGQGTEGRAHLEEALRIQQRALGPKHPRVGATLTNLAVFLTQEGHYGEALESYRQAIEIVEEAYPEISTAPTIPLLNSSRILVHEGRFDEAAQALRRYLDGYQRSTEADEVDPVLVASTSCEISLYEGRLEQALAQCEQARHLHEADLHREILTNSADIYRTLGTVLAELGRSEAAEAALRQAVGAAQEIKRSASTPSIFHDVVQGDAARSLAKLLLATGRVEEARSMLEQARAAYDGTMCKKHPLLLEVDVGMGEALLRLGEVEQARDRLSKTARELETHTDLVGISLVDALSLLALAERAAGEHVGAREHARRAVALADRLPRSMAVHAARARFALARSLEGSPQDRDEALALARQAQEGLRTARTRAEHDEVSAWLEEHGG
ncbi:serine/threonine-protein kinase [Paraliomyxa miuraensis]|uniref:serine/threonine-protein kinase n=1 Tax=Paraliomyxa miuraensis TaxID=376150 RepID=UPI002252EBC0|nr:serine/threonine-protein kinase [Paraliomyxa miuraensis]MCX4246277.1 tetratricopeptide repeat protein [Paraliomyxa miuraensis]